MYYKDDKIKTTCEISNARIEYCIDLKGEHEEKDKNKKPFKWEATARGETIESLFMDLCEKLNGYEEVDFRINNKKKNKITPIELIEWLNKEAEKFTKIAIERIKESE